MNFSGTGTFSSGNHSALHDFDEFVVVFVEVGGEVEVGGNSGDLFRVGPFDPLLHEVVVFAPFESGGANRRFFVAQSDLVGVLVMQVPMLGNKIHRPIFRDCGTSYVHSFCVQRRAIMNLKAMAAGLLIFCAGVFPASAELNPREWTIDREKRQAIVSIPASTPTNGCPLVFVFHGHGGSAAQAARSFRIHEVWPEAMVVYMQGLPTPGQLTDPEGKKNGWNSKPDDPENRDLTFFDTVFRSLQAECKIDPNRIYSTGHSNGGGFTYCLWAARGELFAAMAPSGALSKDGVPMMKPKPVLHLAGETDPLVKYEWQDWMIQIDRKLNGCEKTGVPWASSGDLTGTLYPSKSGTPVVTLLHPGGHTFPKEAPELIVRFFKENVRK